MRTFADLPQWAFALEEVSAGVYEVIGTHVLGLRVHAKGLDPEALLTECRAQAAKIASQRRT